ncbi:MAG: CHASE2 domain-containing protein, partial [Cyanobacteria bacterium P01_H01_bin.121]
MKLAWPFSNRDRAITNQDGNDDIIQESPQRWQRQQILVASAYALAALWTLGGAFASGLNLVEANIVEQRLQDTFFRIRGPIAPPDEIVILGMDESTFAEVDFYLADAAETWPEHVNWLISNPWHRAAHAAVVQRLIEEAGAKSVAIDVTFAGPSAFGP